jgi:hypothetical protein
MILMLSFFTITATIHAQEETQSEKQTNVQNYTPSKLLEKGKWDIKWFNNLYTQTKEEANGNVIDIPRSNFFTSSLEVFTGVSDNRKINVGLILEFRSNSFADQAIGVFRFKNEAANSRVGLSHIAPSIKIAPFNLLPRFSIQSSFYIPVFEQENNQNGYLANKSYIWQNRFFYDYTFPENKFQLFSELGTRFFFGEKKYAENGSVNKNGGYANNSLELVPGAFLSYFPSSKFIVLGFVQQQVLIDLGNNFSQNYTAIGFGAKYQLSTVLNVETLYSKFIRGNDSGLGQSFNMGLRAIF